MGPEHFTGAAAGRGAAADGARRDVRRGHGRLPRALPARPRRRRAPRSRRCCTRSSRRRTCTTRTRTGSTCSRAPRDGERLVHECFGDAAAWIPYIRPGFTLSKQVGEAVRDNPDLKLIVLGQARPDRVGRHRRGGVPQDDRGHQPGRRVRQRAHGRRVALRRAQAASPPGRCTTLLPAIRGAVSSERAKVLTVDTSDRVMEFVCSEQAARARDGRRAVPGPPRAHQARCRCGSRARTRRRSGSPSSPSAYRGGLPRVLRGPRRRGRRARRPRRRGSCSSRAWAWSPPAPRPRRRRSRATSTTARSR